MPTCQCSERRIKRIEHRLSSEVSRTKGISSREFRVRQERTLDLLKASTVGDLSMCLQRKESTLEEVLLRVIAPTLAELCKRVPCLSPL